MRSMKKQCWKYASFILACAMLTACGSMDLGTDANPEESVTVVPNESNGEEIEGQMNGEDNAERPDGETLTDPVKGNADGSGQQAEAAEEEEPAQQTEAQGQEDNRVIRDLSQEEWEQIEQDERLISLHSESGGNYYVDLEERTVYYREIYAHEREDGSYFHPSYSSASDETMFAAGGTDENGKTLYDVYCGNEILISGLAVTEGAGEYLLDVCYDEEAQEVLVLTYHKDSEKKEEGFMIYHASEDDTCIEPLQFFPILTGDDYEEFVYHDWIWSAILTPEAIYYDILPVQRIDVRTGEVTEWGLTKEAYTEATGIENPMRFQDTKAAGNGYIMTIVANPDPAFDDMPENIVDTYLIYTEDGSLVDVIPNVH